tara:strand:- start:428 stop:811 length:384 start_codon:yes stop_codon:yes gene_type:complete
LENQIDFIQDKSIRRAIDGLRCFPLNENFYQDIQIKGINADSAFLKKSKYQVKGSKWFKNSASLESSFLWLIRIGVLRREVDGQGLTSRVRLTPLGRLIIEQDPTLPSQKIFFLEKMVIWFRIKLPF